MTKLRAGPRIIANEWARIIPLVLLSFSAVSVLIAGAPSALGSDDSPDNVNGDWIQYGFNAAHTGFNPHETTIGPENVGSLVELWTSEVGGFFFGSPVVANRKVFMGNLDGSLYALDAATGAVLWVGLMDDFFPSSVATRHGLVFGAGYSETMKAYNSDTGEIVWTKNSSGVKASPTINGRTLYFTDISPPTLRAVDAETSATKWAAFVMGGGNVFDQAPVVDDGRVFQMRTNATLTAYDARDGTQLWSKSAFSEGTQAAAYGMLFYADNPDLIALDAATGDEVWRAPVIPSSTLGNPAVAYGRVFMTESTTVALDAATGTVLWETGAASASGPSVANGVVYGSALNDVWNAYDARTGALLWSVAIGSCVGGCTDAVPVISNGRLFLASGGVIRAYGLPR